MDSPYRYTVVFSIGATMPNPDPIEFFEERIAIIQYDGGRSRPDARYTAVVLTKRYCDRLHLPYPKISDFTAYGSADIQWSDEEGKPVYSWKPSSPEFGKGW